MNGFGQMVTCALSKGVIMPFPSVFTADAGQGIGQVIDGPINAEK